MPAAWSATSYQLLRNDALSCERWNRLHPGESPRVPYVVKTLKGAPGPVIATSDYMKAVPDMIGRWVTGRPFVPLGTDGFGRSDTRENLRRHFEVDAEHVVATALWALQQQGAMKPEEVAKAIKELGINPEAIDPRDA